MDSEQDQLPPREAARLYDFSESLLRRYAAVFEQYGGKLGRDNRGGRIYTHDIMRLFAEVKERVRENNETVEAAMTTITVPSDREAGEIAPPAQSEEALDLLRRLVADQEDRRHRDRQLLEALETLERRLGSLERQLEPPKRRPWWRWWGRG